MADDSYRKALSRFACFRVLEEGDARALQSHLTPIACAAGEVLFHQGDPDGTMYLLAEGEVEIRVHVPGQGDQVLSVLGPGVLIGEISFLLNESRTATVAARTAARLWKLENAALLEALRNGEWWAQYFVLEAAQGLARRITAMDGELVRLIAEHREAERQGEAEPQGEAGRVGELEQLRRKLFQEWSF